MEDIEDSCPLYDGVSFIAPSEPAVDGGGMALP